MIKRTTCLIVITILLFNTSCNTVVDVKIDQIENNIKQNAAGMDISYKPLQTDTLAIVDVKTSLKNYSTILKIDGNQQSLKNSLQEIDKIILEAQDENDADIYHLWSFRKLRLASLLSKDSNQIDYKVIKHKYSIKNPLLNDAIIIVTNFYFFDGSNKLIGKVSDMDMNTYAKQFFRFDYEKYEVALFDILMQGK